MRASRRGMRLPILVLVAVVGLAGCGGDDDDGGSAADAPASSSAAATTTAGGGGGTPAPTPSPTPSSTPAPTPAPTPTPTPGTPIAGESLTAEQAAHLQEEVDGGHQPWRTDVAAVADAFVAARLGWSGASIALADPHTAEVTDPAGGHVVTLQLRQPAREGTGGIWVVVGGVWLS